MRKKIKKPIKKEKDFSDKILKYWLKTLTKGLTTNK